MIPLTNGLAHLQLASVLYDLPRQVVDPHITIKDTIVTKVLKLATVAALTGLGADRRLVVILGGDGKGQDFSPLAAPIARYARAVLLIGRDAPQIRAALAGSGVPLLDAATLPEAVQLASQRAHAGDAVLLSPACASLDMFDNYAHRARVFVDAVHALAEDAGQSLDGGLA